MDARYGPVAAGYGGTSLIRGSLPPRPAPTLLPTPDLAPCRDGSPAQPHLPCARPRRHVHPGRERRQRHPHRHPPRSHSPSDCPPLHAGPQELAPATLDTSVTASTNAAAHRSTPTRRHYKGTNTTPNLALLSILARDTFAPADLTSSRGPPSSSPLAAPGPRVASGARPDYQAAYARLRRLSRSPRSRGCQVPARLRFPAAAGCGRSALIGESGTGNP